MTENEICTSKKIAPIEDINNESALQRTNSNSKQDDRLQYQSTEFVITATEQHHEFDLNSAHSKQNIDGSNTTIDLFGNVVQDSIGMKS